jgi:hypothetical protein
MHSSIGFVALRAHFLDGNSRLALAVRRKRVRTV